MPFTQEMQLNKMRASTQEIENMNLLYQASYRGSVSILNSLMQKHPQILHNISQTQTTTPLHISALLGHLEFTKALLAHNPELAVKLNSSGSTTLHLASAEGHIHIVKELSHFYDRLCLSRDKEGKIPVHYATMRGQIEVVQELIIAKPESLSFPDNRKSTVFHLCVTYNHLETLKALVQLELAITPDLHNFTNSDGSGNTVLHLAIMLKQVETIRYLLSISKIKEVANLKNQMGFTPHDILQLCPGDFKSLEIQFLLMEAGIEPEKKERPCCIRILKWIGNWFKHKGDWLDEMRGNLSLVSTVISTITFQALVNPPGGFIQQGLSKGNSTTSSSNDSLDCATLNDGNDYCPGEAMSSFTLPDAFNRYLICNTIAFISSLSVTLLLVSGVPMKNKVVIWMLSIGMCIVLTSLALTYIYALRMLIPDHFLDEKTASILIGTTITTWAGLLLLVVVLITLRFFIWLVKKCLRPIKKISRC